MTALKKVIILFNPNSTGASEDNAKSFADELVKKMKSLEVSIIATQYQGHAAEIAAEHAADSQLLIVSSSGDGGYNEVINGMLLNDSKAVTAVLPSGNANDHHSTLGSGDLVNQIAEGRIQKIDMLKLDGMVNGKKWRRFAHSYIGFGLTPKVGRELTERRPNVLTEKWYALRHIMAFRYVTLVVDGEVKKYSNLVFATIPRMSKIIKLNDNASVHDGLMEVYDSPRLTTLQALKQIFVASLKGMSHSSRTDHFELKTVKPTLVQLDGEVFRLDANSDLSIQCKKAVLRTIL